MNDLNFFALDLNEIQNILQNHTADTILNFILKHSSEKDIITEKISASNSTMSNDNLDSSFQNIKVITSFSEISTSDLATPSTNNDGIIIDPNISLKSHCTNAKNTESDLSDNNSFYIKNSLYYYLNEDLPGRIILGTYKLTMKFDRKNLTDLLMYRELRKDLLDYK